MFFETTLTTDRIEAARASGAWPDERIRDALLFRGFGYVSMHKEIRGELDFIDEIVVVGDRQADTNGWDEVVELGRQSGIEETTLDLLTPDCNEVSEIVFTSGTTGQPKGVLHTINTLAAGVQGILPNFTKGSEEVVHMGSTFAHQTGFLFGARLPLMVGGSGVYQDVLDPVVFADLIESKGITASAGAAPFLADLLGVPGLEDRNLSSFTTFGCFGSAIPLPLLEDALLRHAAVAGVAVVAKRDERLGEVGCAFVIAVVGSEPPTLNDLPTHLEEQGMTPQFWPEDLRLVEEFPMTAFGKVQKFRLRATLTS